MMCLVKDWHSLVGFVTGAAFLVCATGLAHAQTEQEAPQAIPAPTMNVPTGATISATQRAREAVDPASPGESDTIHVHVDGQPGSTLEENLLGSAQWSLVCEAPCDRVVRLDLRYRVTAANSRESKPFTLIGSPGQHLTISVSKNGAVVGGWVLGFLGGLAIPVGLSGIALSGSGGCFAECASTSNAGEKWGGWILVVSGAAALVGGILLVTLNPGTVQDQSVLEHRPAEASSRADTAWLRTPVWRASLEDAEPGLAKAGIPILSASFQ
jgi:hypothetical protein